MRKESVLLIIGSTILNLGWSIVFDLLPSIIDFDTSNIEPRNYLVLAFGYVVINICVLLIIRLVMKNKWKKETRINLIREAINKQITNEVNELPNRPPQVIPGDDRPVFFHYSNAITQLEENNGWIEFKLEGIPPDFNDKLPISLCDVRPGMSKYFMVVIQTTNDREIFPPCCRIIPDDCGTEREFTEDWYNTIFAIFSSFSKFISPKIHGPGWDLVTQYIISGYKFINRGKENILRIRIV